MNQVWLQVFMAMICGSIIKMVFYNVFLWVVIDLLVLGVSYILLRRFPYIDIKKSMLFIGGLTAINILVDLNVIDGVLGNIAGLILVGWVVFGGGKGKSKSILRHKWHK